MASYDPRGFSVIDDLLLLASAATAPGAIASAGNTSVTSTNVVDLTSTTFRPNNIPRVVVRFPKGLALTSLETLEVRIQDCATSGGTYVTIAEDKLNNESVSSDGSTEIGVAKSRRYVRAQLYLSNTAGTSDLSSYTYTAFIAPLVS